MTCPTERELLDWAEDPAGRGELAAHVTTCGRCQASLHAAARTAEVPLGEGPLQQQLVMPAPAVLPVGTLVGRFVITGQVGAGGMGQVYAANDPELGRTVALKLLTAQASSDSSATDARSRLRREAQAQARLSHPNVVSIYEVGTHEGQVFLAMELVHGQTLRAWLKERPRSWREVVPVFLGAGAGLAAAHEAGLVHRDFKPRNVLLGDDGRVRVLDFGIARSTDTAPVHYQPNLATEASASSDLLDTPLTMTGHLTGTPGYIAPEHIKGEPVDARADQFAFGVTLYEALWGRRPYPSRTVLEYLQALSGPPRPAKTKDHQVPRWLRAVVMRCLAPLPADRYASMVQVLAALHGGLRAERRRPWLFAGALAAVAVAAVGGAQLWRGARQCAHQERHLEGVWDDAMRAQVEAAFRAIDKPWALRASEGVRARLDAKAVDWVALAGQTCQAVKRDEGTAQHEVAVMRDGCLRAQLEEFGALARALTQLDPSLARRAPDFVETFELSSDCHSQLGLGRLTAENVAPALAPLAAELRTRLLRARVASFFDRDHEALTLAKAALDDATRAGLLGFVAEAQYLLGGLLEVAGDSQAAEAAYSAALAAAQEAGHDEMVFWAASDVSRILAQEFDRVEEAQRVLRTAEAAFARLGRSPYLEPWLLGLRASLAADADDPKRALTLYQEQLAAVTRLVGPAHRWVATALGSVGDAYFALDDLNEAVVFHRRAYDVIVAARGEDNPEVEDFQLNLGWTLAEIGEREAGLKLLQRAAERTSEVENLAGAINATNWAYQLCVEDPVRAAEVNGRALAKYETTLDTMGVADLLVTNGRIHRFLGHPDAALTDCRRALTSFETYKGPIGRNRFLTTLMCIGHAQLDLGDARGAVQTLERATAALTDADRGIRAELEFTLARALVANHQSLERARALAQRALERFKPYPALTVERADIEAWLASPSAQPRRLR